MTTTTGILLKGVVQVDVRTRQGTLVEQRVFSNRIVDHGMELMSLLLVSSFVNETSENVSIRPIQAIGVGTPPYVPPAGGGVPQVDFRRTQLEAEWTRRRIEQVEVLRAGVAIRDANDNTVDVLRLQSRIQGAYGNRVEVAVANATARYEIQISDRNATVWNGTAWVTGPAAPRSHGGDTLREVLASIATDPVVQAYGPDLDWAGTLETPASGPAMSGGGAGVVVSATFSNTGADTKSLTEAALFTSDDPADTAGRMFNMVRFPVISVTNELDVTFRWKILFQEASSAG
jgi:hypothetical protein